MAKNIDDSFASFLKIYEDIQKNEEEVQTEEDSRFMIIKRVLVEALGWEYSEVLSERYSDSGYADILIKSENKNHLVIEAKKKEKLLVNTKSDNLRYYNIKGAAISGAKEGIDQARRYCSDHGVIFSIITTGFEWIGCYAVGFGKSPDEGKAIVFPSLESIKNNYAKFYDLLSKEGVLERRYKLIMVEADGVHFNEKERLYASFLSHEIHFLGKSKLSSDLDVVFTRFFGMMTGEDDIEMLSKCFVESRESKEADKSLEKITRSLINQVEVFSTGEGKELLGEIQTAIECKRGEFVLIIGNKGAGKSTFIDRFYNLILANELRGKCLLIRIDLANSDGNINSINNWLINQLKNEVEREVFNGEIPGYNDLQGVFFKEYNRWKKGELKYLYEKDKEEFKIRFGGYLQKLIEEKPQEYIRSMLVFAINSRKIMPCIVFDNTDHYKPDFQEAVFQYAQSIHRQLFSFIICPITDKTVWQLSKSGPLQSYVTKSFYLPTPSAKEILNKRVSFIRNKIQETVTDKGVYFLSKGIKISVSDLNAFASCIEEIFIKTDYTSRTISWLCNHDIRRCLVLSQKIATSPSVSIDDLVKVFLLKEEMSISLDTIRRAIYYGDYNCYNSEFNDFVLNVFSVEEDKITSPLLKLSLLKLLANHELSSVNEDGSYMSVENVINYFEPMGVLEGHVYAYLNQLLKYRLVIPYDATKEGVDDSMRVKITHSGKIHLEFALMDKIYITAMSSVTGIRNYNITQKIKSITSAYYENPIQKWLEVIRVFIKYCIDEDVVFLTIPNSAHYDGQKSLRRDLKKRWLIEGEV